MVNAVSRDKFIAFIDLIGFKNLAMEAEMTGGNQTQEPIGPLGSSEDIDRNW
jgi:hypothetical protein